MNEFLSDARKEIDTLEKIGVDVTGPKYFLGKLLRPVHLIDTAVGVTSDAVEAAEQVSLDLATWYSQASDQARREAKGDDDQYWILSAAIV